MRNHLGARQTMRDCAAMIQREADGDPELSGLVAELERQAEVYGREMDNVSRKAGIAKQYRDLKLRVIQASHAAEDRLPTNLGLLTVGYGAQETLATVIPELVVADRDLFFGTPSTT